MAPLDWGLGHATRCIPVIKKLLYAGFKVIIAAEGDQKILLQATFPELEIVCLEGYRLQYGSTKWSTILKIIYQIPKILTAINKENKWLRNFLTNKHLDIVISDNRFGLHNRKTVSVFITHQLRIKTSLGRFADAVIQQINYHFINKFDCCWVPDEAGEENLAGELSHPSVRPRTAIFYTGILSSIQRETIPVTHKLLILLSGPEPQRSIIEKIVLAQLTSNTYPVVLVRGLPAAKDEIASTPLLTVHNYLAGLQLQQVINQSEIILSRSGYSTIMDVLPTGGKCIFIPTPGQAEQEYLAAYMEHKNYACTGLQHNFLLHLLIAKVSAAKLASPLLQSGAKQWEEVFAALQRMLATKQ